jgi:hypothetical protein
LFDISATSSAQVGAQQFILPIFPPKPELESMSNNGFIYTLYKSTLRYCGRFQQREGYLLQPTKSVVLPVKSKCKSMEINDGFWKLNNCNMPIVFHLIYDFAF